MPQFNTKTASEGNVEALCALLNKIIKNGGTTAFDTPLDATEFAGCFLSGSSYRSCFVSVDDHNNALGFQSLTRYLKLPAD